MSQQNRLNARTYVVATLLAVLAETAGGTGLHRNTVTNLDVVDLRAG